MRKMKLKNLCVITMILSSVFSMAAFSGKAVEVIISDGNENACSTDYLLKNAFLFGSSQNLIVSGNYSTVEAVNLRIIFFEPYQFFHPRKTSGE